jgi:hypothetical protein
MATTTNYGWDTPDDTDLVKDGAAAIRTLGSSVDTTTKNLNPQTTTGALAYRSATANVNTALPIGTTGQVLTVAAGVPSWATPAGGGKVLQVVSMSKTSVFSSTATTYTDITGYSLSITPSAATSKILVLFSPSLFVGDVSTQLYQGFRILRDATTIMTNDRANVQGAAALGGGYTWQYIQASFIYLDSPSTTSSVTYKAQTKDDTGIPHGINIGSTGNSTITLMEIGA